MNEKAIFEEPKSKSLTQDQVRRTFSTSQHGMTPVRVIPKKTILSPLDDTTPVQTSTKKFSITAELKKNPALSSSRLLEKEEPDEDVDKQKRRKHHHSDDSETADSDDERPKKVSKLTAHSRLPAEDKFQSPALGEKDDPEAKALEREDAVKKSVNRNTQVMREKKSRLEQKKKKKLGDTTSSEGDSGSAEKEFDASDDGDKNVFLSKKKSAKEGGLKRLIKETPVHAGEKKEKKDDFNMEDGYVSDEKSGKENSDDDDADSDDSDELIEDEQFEQEDEFGEMKEIDDCRACKEAFGTGRNREQIDEYIDKVLATAGNSLSLDSIIDVIYKHVEIRRRKHNQAVSDAKEHIDIWPRHMIKKHLLEHMVRLDMQIKAHHEFNIRAEKLILQQIKGVDPENGTVVLNYKAIDALLKVQKAIKDNTRLNPEASYSYVSDQIPRRSRVKRIIDGVADP
jgi:hypothetical protein